MSYSSFNLSFASVLEFQVFWCTPAWISKDTILCIHTARFLSFANAANLWMRISSSAICFPKPIDPSLAMAFCCPAVEGICDCYSWASRTAYVNILPFTVSSEVFLGQAYVCVAACCVRRRTQSATGLASVLRGWICAWPEASLCTTSARFTARRKWWPTWVSPINCEAIVKHWNYSRMNNVAQHIFFYHNILSLYIILILKMTQAWVETLKSHRLSYTV